MPCQSQIKATLLFDQSKQLCPEVWIGNFFHMNFPGGNPESGVNISPKNESSSTRFFRILKLVYGLYVVPHHDSFHQIRKVLDLICIDISTDMLKNIHSSVICSHFQKCYWCSVIPTVDIWIFVLRCFQQILHHLKIQEYYEQNKVCWLIIYVVQS